MVAAARRASQERLPGTEGGIDELTLLGREYARLRDNRMEILKQEIVVKGKAMEAMRRLNQPTYTYQDIYMAIVPGEEKLKVKVLKDEDEETTE